MRLPLLLLASALLGGTLLSGCVPVVLRPTVDAGSRGNVPENQQTSIHAGTSQRADVLLALGEPDGRAQDESWYVYSLTRTSGVGGFMIFSNGVAGGVVGSQDMTRIVVRFDPSGRVTSVEPQHLHCRHNFGAFGNAGGESKPCVSPVGDDLKPKEEAAQARVNGPGKQDDLLATIPLEDISGPSAGATDIPLQITDRRANSRMELTALGLPLRGIELKPGEIQLVRTVVQGSLQEAIATRGASGAPPQVTCDLVDFSVTTPSTALYWDVTARVEWVIHVGAQQRTVIAESKQRAWLAPTAGVVERVVIKALKQAAADTGHAATEEFADVQDHGGA